MGPVLELNRGPHRADSPPARRRGTRLGGRAVPRPFRRQLDARHADSLTAKRNSEHATIAPSAQDPLRVVRPWLRAEGAAAFVAGVALYGWLGGPWLALVPLLLVPDISMVGYLRGPRMGALLYNLGHTYVVALATLGLGLAVNVNLVALAGAVLIAHTGADRALGYGLKLPTSFQETHLGRIGRRR